MKAGHWRKRLAALLDAQAVAEVVAEHDVEARQQHAQEKIAERAERALFALREQEAVVDVAVQDELRAAWLS